MTTIQNFEELAGYVYFLTWKQKFSRDFGLCNQIQNTVGSTMHNIAEGFESGYDPEFVRFLKMTHRSAGEVQSELYLALDADFITQEELKKAYDLVVETKKLINDMISYLCKT